MKKLVIWLLVLGVGSYFGAKTYLHHRVSKGLDELLVQLSPFADVSYANVSSTIFGELGVEGVQARFGEFEDSLYIDKLSIKTPSFLYLLNLNEIYGSDQQAEIPDSLGLLVAGFKVPVKADYFRKMNKAGEELIDADDRGEPGVECAGKYGFSPETLSQLGYDELIFDLDLRYTQDERYLTVDASASIRDVYDVDVMLKLANQLSAATFARRSMQPQLIEGRLKYVDQSINQRVREHCRRVGLSDEETLQAQIDAFMFTGADNGVEFDAQIIDVYKAYLAGNATFALHARPDSVVDMTKIELYKPSDVPALLNLTAESY